MKTHDEKSLPPTAEDSIAEDAQRNENSQSQHPSLGYDDDDNEDKDDLKKQRNETEDFKTD